MRYLALNLLFLILLVMSCTDDGPESDMDPAFIPFVDRFIEEANIRGITIDPSRIGSIQFGETPATSGVPNPNGVCFLSSGRVVIDKIVWNRLNDISRERLIFHELGHCVLDRHHDNALLPNGECKSIMKGHEENFCFSNLGLSEFWRNYFIDELFDPTTSLPDLYLTEVHTVPTKTLIDTLATSLSSLYIGIPFEELGENFELIIDFIDWKPNSNIKLNFSDYEFVSFDDFMSITSGVDLIYALRDHGIGFPDTLKIRVVKRNDFVYILYEEKIFLIDSFDLDITSGVFLTIENANGFRPALKRDIRFQLRNIEG